MQSLIDVSPDKTLPLKGPFDRKGVEGTLLIHNTQKGSPIIFKISSSEPEKYQFHPEAGIVEPDKTQLVKVSPVPFHYKEEERELHRIIVTATHYDANLGADPQAFWKVSDRAPDRMVSEQIIAISLQPTEAEKKKGQRNVSKG